MGDLEFKIKSLNEYVKQNSKFINRKVEIKINMNINLNLKTNIKIKEVSYDIYK